MSSSCANSRKEVWRTVSVIITDSDHVILSAIQSETIANRLDNNDDQIDTEAED